MNYDAHPLADKIPLMSDEEFETLKEDIRKNGQQQPIIIHEGQVIDGRHRQRACLELGIEPEIKAWDGSGSLIALIYSLNICRRHLTPSQRAALGVELLPALEAENEELRRKKISFSRTNETSQIFDPSQRSDERAAELVNANRQYIADAKAIKQQAPEKFEAIKSGALTITEAKRTLKEERREQRRQENRELVAQTPAPMNINARFATITLDPPWDWEDEGDADQLGRARPTYSTMSIEQIRELPVGDLADCDCHLYLWITNRSLPKGFDLLDAWGFRFITCLTWCKPSFGLGNYFRGSSEQVLFGVKGSQPLKRKDAGTWFAAPRGPNGHSSKPLEFYDLVESCSPGPYLEMFARSGRPDWTSWGAEA